MKGVKNRNRHLRKVGPNQSTKGLTLPRRGDEPKDLQVPAQVPAQL